MVTPTRHLSSTLILADPQMGAENPAMNRLRLTTAFIFVCAATAFAAPRDRIDPKALKDKVSLTLGTKGTIQFKRRGDSLTEPKLTKEAQSKPGMGVEFKKEGQLLTLRVHNPFPKALRCRAAARLKGRREYLETGIFPVMAGLSSGRSWEDPIEEFILFDFKLTDAPILHLLPTSE
jgi:hypothetical protein